MQRWLCMFILCLSLLTVCAAGEEITPTDVELYPTEITLDIASNEAGILTAKIYPSDAKQDVEWTSSDEALFAVENGVITARKAGSGWVTVTAADTGISEKCLVTVLDTRTAPESVFFPDDSVTMETAETRTLRAECFPENANDALTWTTSDRSVATVSEDGTVTANSVGSAVITAASALDQGVHARITVNVVYRHSPTSVKIGEVDSEYEVGDTFSLPYEIGGEDASQLVTFETSDANVAVVDEFGTVTAKGYGECRLSVICVRNTHIRDEVRISVSDSRVPNHITVYPSPLSLEPSQSRALAFVVFPQEPDGKISWRSADPETASVDENGVVTAYKEGSTVIYAESFYTAKIYARVPVYVKYGANIEKIKLSLSEITLEKGDSVSVNVEIQPENASRAIVTEYTDPAVAYLDENGILHATRCGETDVVISYYRNPSVSAMFHVKVLDERFPISMETEDLPEKIVLYPGDGFSANFAFSPDTADTSFAWRTSDERIVRISDAGTPVAFSRGQATVTAQSLYNPNLKKEFTVTVEGDGYTLVMPDRRTGVDGIEENLAKIERVRESAIRKMKELLDAGEMLENEFLRREQVVNRAFEMYSFAWMVEDIQKYWKAENSEDGAKDFKPGIVYYGLPYTSGSNHFHMYNFQMALDEEWYLPVDGQKYYLLNQTGDRKNVYVGNDCSVFVAQALFGTGYDNGETVKTGTLYYDYRLIPVEDAKSLRAGDVLVRHSSHVLMFLYWADEAHSQAVFIEQGGSEPGINTVSTSVYPIHKYLDNFYRIRRLRTFD